MLLINESPSVFGLPKKVKSVGKSASKIRMECVLQTADEINRNKRRYSKRVIQEGLDNIKKRFEEGSLLAELDHPTSDSPTRQMTVLYKEASHRILEVGWEGNKLVGLVETLRTPNGYILRNLCQDKLPVGFSFRGMGDLRELRENGQICYEVTGPLICVTWDSVSYPSHTAATLIRITESSLQNTVDTTKKVLIESAGYKEHNGMICTESGICYLPNDFDQMVERRILSLDKKFI